MAKVLAPQPNTVWRHYKGTIYRVLGTSKHTETGELLVVYTERMQSSKMIWARPLSMWHDDIGEGVPRFEAYSKYLSRKKRHGSKKAGGCCGGRCISRD